MTTAPIRSPMEKLLALEMVRVTEAAAIAAARHMGRGDRHEADRAATEAMRRTMDDMDIAATIVIGEGERDEAPMLYIGERLGRVDHEDGDPHVQVDIAVDPLEGTNLVATGSRNAITVLAASERGGLLNAPDTYFEKLAVGPVAAGKVDIRLSPTENLERIAQALGRGVNDLTVVILDRPRHVDLIREVREAGARISLISDGDVIGGISTAISGHGHPRADGDRCGARGCPDGRGPALPRRRDPGPLPVPQRRPIASAPARCRASTTRSTSSPPRSWPAASTSCSRPPASPTARCSWASASSVAAHERTRW